jgi:hypothetical protein
MDRQAYIDRAYEEIAKAEARVATYAGDCSECKWSKAGWLDNRKCTHGAVECAAFNVTNAYAKDRVQECGYQRDTQTLYGPVLCGPDGALFEAR